MTDEQALFICHVIFTRQRKRFFILKPVQSFYRNALNRLVNTDSLRWPGAESVHARELHWILLE